MAKFIFRESFDTYNGRNAPIGYLSRWSQGGGFAEQPGLAAGRFLGQSLRTIWQNLFMRPLDEEVSEMTIGFSFKLESLPTILTSSVFVSILNPSIQSIIGICVDPDGSLYINRNANFRQRQVLQQSAPGLIQPNVWNFFELEIVLHATEGEFRVFMNGDPEPVLDVSGVNTLGAAGPARYLSLFFRGDFTSNSSDTIGYQSFDDVYVWDEPIRRGPIRIESLPVNGNGAHQDFSPLTGTDNAAMIDEVLPNIDDYVIGTAPGEYDQYAVQNLSSSAAEIFEVNVVALGQQTGSTIRAVALGIESGAVVSKGDDIYMGSGFARYERRLLLNPATGLQWTKAEVDALILRPEITV